MRREVKEEAGRGRRKEKRRGREGRGEKRRGATYSDVRTRLSLSSAPRTAATSVPLGSPLSCLQDSLLRGLSGFIEPQFSTIAPNCLSKTYDYMSQDSTTFPQ